FFFCFFFFSSRRRHTRFSRDWSSDVCSSDLHRSSQTRQGLKWTELDQQTLLDALPFWAWIDVKRVQKNLLDLGLILVDAQTGRQDSWLFAINQRSAESAVPVPPPRPPAASNPQLARNNGRASYISDDWQPDGEWLAMCRQ